MDPRTDDEMRVLAERFLVNVPDSVQSMAEAIQWMASEWSAWHERQEAGCATSLEEAAGFPGHVADRIMQLDEKGTIRRLESKSPLELTETVYSSILTSVAIGAVCIGLVAEAVVGHGFESLMADIDRMLEDGSWRPTSEG